MAAMNYTLTTLWYDRHRYVPGMLAVAFSALLIFMQTGLLLGLFSLTSLPIDHVDAHIWVGDPVVKTVDLGRPIPEGWFTRLAAQPEVEQVETYLIAILVLDTKEGRSELCTVIGCRLQDGSIGVVREMSPSLRARLSEPGSVVIDESEAGKLGLSGPGDGGEVFGHRVQVVGMLKKGTFKSLATPYLLCSLETARLLLLNLDQDKTIFLLARCRRPQDAGPVVERLRKLYPDMSTYTSAQFSERTRVYWLTAGKAGIATACTAVLGLGIGLAITVQTLYAATAAARREYAVLEALGIPRWRIAGTVLAQSFWVGAAGIALAIPIAFGLAQGAEALGLRVLLPVWLLIMVAGLTMGMAFLSGLAALRSLRLIEPVLLLR